MKLKMFSRGMLGVLQKTRQPKNDDKDPTREDIQANVDARLLTVPVCTADEASAAACHHHRLLGSQQRCSAASFMSVSCPYLGKVLPHPDTEEEKKNVKKRLTMTIEPPPEV